MCHRDIDCGLTHSLLSYLSVRTKYDDQLIRINSPRTHAIAQPAVARCPTSVLNSSER
jgi:hypothetical protein